MILLYVDRSGSTYLATRLAEHPQIGVTLEGDVFVNLIKGRAKYAGKQALGETLDRIYADEKFRAWQIERQTLETRCWERGLPMTPAQLAQEVLEAFFGADSADGVVWLVKQGSLFHIQGLKQLFPGALFVHIYRDGRAVFNSKKSARDSRSGLPMESDVVQAARDWARLVGLPREKLSRDELLEVRYEDLVSAPDAVLGQVTEFMGVPHMEDLQGAGRSRRADRYESMIPSAQRHLHPNVGRAPLRERIDAWRAELSNAEVYLFERYAGARLAELGYEVAAPRGRLDAADRSAVLAIYTRSLFERGARRVRHLVRVIAKGIRDPRSLVRSVRWRLRESML